MRCYTESLEKLIDLRVDLQDPIQIDLVTVPEDAVYVTHAGLTHLPGRSSGLLHKDGNTRQQKPNWYVLERCDASNACRLCFQRAGNIWTEILAEEFADLVAVQREVIKETLQSVVKCKKQEEIRGALQTVQELEVKMQQLMDNKHKKRCVLPRTPAVGYTPTLTLVLGAS